MSRIGSTGGLLKGFFDLPPELMTAVATVLGFALMGNLDANQQNSLGNFLILVGQLLETSANQSFLLQANQQTDQMEALQRQIDELRRRLDGQSTV